MRKLTMIALFAGFLTMSLTSCRDKKSPQQEIIEEMQDKGADIKVKDNKIKMETEDEKVKIKTDDDGNVKIKRKDKE